VLVRESRPADLAGVYHLTPRSREFLKTRKSDAAIPERSDATIQHSRIHFRADTLAIRSYSSAGGS